MNPIAVIKSRTRNTTGKNSAIRLREQGLIPAVLYGHNFPPVTLSINISDLNTILKPAAHTSSEHALHKLSIEDRQDIAIKDVMIKEIQRDPVSQRILHMDLYAVRMDEKIIVPVRINITGKPPGVQRGGILQQILREIEVKCFPADIPHSFEADVSMLDIGQSLHVSDIVIPENVELHEDPHAPVVSVIAPTVIKEEVPAEAAVAEAPAAEEGKKAEEKKESA
jgi:large subunit ribosomal protein L25